MSVRVWRVCGYGHAIFLPASQCPLGITLHPRPCPRAQLRARIRARLIWCPRVRGFSLPVAIFNPSEADHAHPAAGARACADAARAQVAASSREWCGRTECIIWAGERVVSSPSIRQAPPSSPSSELHRACPFAVCPGASRAGIFLPNPFFSFPPRSIPKSSTHAN
jgi:hypothetical protein